jgi:hypothetical protein
MKTQPTLAELRAAAYQAAADHKSDMKSNPQYARTVKAIERRKVRAARKVSE